MSSPAPLSLSFTSGKQLLVSNWGRPASDPPAVSPPRRVGAGRREAEVEVTH